MHMAKNDKGAHSFQPLLGGDSLNSLGSPGGEVADPMIEAESAMSIESILEVQHGIMSLSPMGAFTPFAIKPPFRSGP